MDVISFLRARGKQWAYTRYIKEKFSYTAGGLLEYIGFAPGPAATSDAAWIIWKLTYDGSNRLTDAQMADVGDADGVAWDDRATSTYL